MDHVVCHPKVSLPVFTDDLALDTTRDNKFDMVETLRDAAIDFSVSVEQVAKLPLAREKSAALSNTLYGAHALRKCMGELGGPVVDSVRSLGVDFWAAAPIKASRRFSTRKSRYASLAKRLPRLLTLKRTNRKVAAKVFTSGFLPAVLFDAPVFGLSGVSLQRVRRATGAFLGIAGKKRSLDLAFASKPNSDPEILTAKQVVKRYATEVWNASLPLEFRDGATIPLGQLAVGVGSYLKSNPSPPILVEGPLSALHKALSACGWTFKSPFSWIDSKGKDVHLPSFGPVRVVKRFVNDYEEAIQTRGVKKLSEKHQTQELHELVEKGALWTPLLRLYRKLDHRRARVLLAIVCNGIFTNSDFFNFGYDVDFACEACGLGHDSIFHRCFSCPSVENRAKLAIGEDQFNKIISLGSSSIAGNRCLVPAPPVASAPSNTTLYESVGFADGESFSNQDGFIFGDGSCLAPRDPLFSRAGWAIVQVNTQGEVLRAIYGCVPNGMEQSSLTAEFMAFWAAFENGLQCSYAGDCQEVLRSYSKGFKHMIQGDSSHADLCKSVLLRCNQSRQDRILATRKVKAHRSLEQTLADGDPEELYWGNFHADAFARKGAELHPPSSGDFTIFNKTCKAITEMALHMVDCVAELCADRLVKYGRLKRLPDGLRLRNKSSDAGLLHDFKWNGTHWNCMKCFLRTNAPSCLPAGRNQSKGFTFFEDLLGDPNGHSLWSTCGADGKPLVYCSRCWHYASAFPRCLRDPCSGEGMARGPNKFYLINGLHPISRLRFDKPTKVQAL